MSRDGLPSPTLALVRREALVIAQSGRHYGVLLALIALLLLYTMLVLAIAPLTSIGMEGFGQKLFAWQFRSLYFVALLIVPMMAVASVVSERKNDCFPMLYTTLIRPGWILWSKLLVILGFFGILYAGCLPFTGVVYFFAGVERASLFQCAMVLFSLAFATAGLGLFVSTRVRCHHQAVYQTVIGILLLRLASLPLLWLVNLLGIPEGLTSPLQQLVQNNVYDALVAGFSDWPGTFYFVVYHGSIGCVLLLMALQRILPDTRRWRPTTPGWVLPFGRRQIPKLRPTIQDHQNPVAIRDLWLNPLAQGRRRLALAALGLAAGWFFLGPHMLLSAAGPLRYPQVFGMERYLFFLLLPAMVALALASERENGTIEDLRVSLLSDDEILRGKILGVWCGIAPFVYGLIAVKLFVMAALALILPLEDAISPITYLGVSVPALVLTIFAILVFSAQGAKERESVAGAIAVSYLSVFGGFFIVQFISVFPSTFLLMASGVWGPDMPILLQSVIYYLTLLGVMMLKYRLIFGGIIRYFTVTRQENNRA